MVAFLRQHLNHHPSYELTILEDTTFEWYRDALEWDRAHDSASLTVLLALLSNDRKNKNVVSTLMEG